MRNALERARSAARVVPALQRQMVAATPCEATVTMDCGHVPQLTRAQDLAEILLGFAAA